MIRYHLTITIFEPFFQKKLNARGKINSVWFADYDLFMEKIINEMDLDDLNKFKLNLFETFKNTISFVKVTQFIDGEFLEGYAIPSVDYQVSSDVIAKCIPSRKLRDKYFEYDCLRERYFINSSFVFYLKS